MDTLIEKQIIALEEKLSQAMLNSDLAVLDELLAPQLMFTTHLGQVLSKQDDIAAHTAGVIKISEISSKELRIQAAGEVVIVSARIFIKGIFAATQADVDLRFTRVWAPLGDGHWHIIAGHSSAIV